MPSFDGRRARGFTRWLLRQRRRTDRVASLARWAHQQPGWPHTALEEEAFVAFVQAQPGDWLTALAAAWGEYQAARGFDLDLDWGEVLVGAERRSTTEQGPEPSIAWSHPRLARLILSVRLGDPGALRELASEGRRRGALEVLEYVRDQAIAHGDWALVCDLLASGDERFSESTYALATRRGDRYLLDRTLELGSTPFLGNVYERVRVERDWEHQHIALAALKALLPERWQSWLPETFHHPAEVGMQSESAPPPLPALPACLVCLESPCRCA